MFFENINITLIDSAYHVHTKGTDDILKMKPRLFHAFIYYVNGSARYVYKNCEFKTAPGSFVYLPKGEEYEFIPMGDSHCICINFDTLDSLEIMPFTKIYGGTQQLNETFTRIARTSIRRSYGYVSAMTYLLYKIVNLIQTSERNGYVSSRQYEKIKPAVLYIEENYLYENIMIEKLAKICELSTKYFTQIFERSFGIQPKKYIQRLRVEKAKEILVNSNAQISEVAEEAGFSSGYYFSRIFKELCGISPTDYRKTSVYE
jgi:AraC-like DNA-binding protein